MLNQLIKVQNFTCVLLVFHTTPHYYYNFKSSNDSSTIPDVKDIFEVDEFAKKLISGKQGV